MKFIKTFLKKFKKITEGKFPSLQKTVKNTYLIFIAVILFSTFYHLGYSQKIIPGVRVGDISLGGLDYRQARELLQKKETELDKTLSLKDGEFSFELKAEDIDLIYDLDATVSRAYEIGRSRNFLIDTKDKLAGLVKPLRVKAFFDVNDDALSNFFATVRGEINIEPESASFVLENGNLSISAPVDGRRVSDQEIYNIVISSLESWNFGAKVLPEKELPADVSRADLESVYETVKNRIETPFHIFYEDRTWAMSPTQILSLIQVVPKLTGTSLVVNDAKFEAYLNMLEQEINKLPRGKVTSTAGDMVTGFELTISGYAVEGEIFGHEFRKAFFGGEESVEVAVREINGLRDDTQYGIFALLGAGSSKFAGSIASRIHNLTLAAGRTNGVLVPPGEIYSLNNSVGAISGVTGYDSAWIISGGRTVLGDGGGVCQTSTTLFRAVLNAGLPVVTRHPHAYRVSYYEQDSPVGFDASIYQPSLDFRFKNDTPNYVLVQSSWDLYEKSLEFKIYGTPDGREVTISEPVVTNFVAPPEALYQDDPNLDKGVTKQIDWAAWGSDAYFTRKVMRGDNVLFEDSYSTRYQPWQAVYLVGTKE